MSASTSFIHPDALAALETAFQHANMRVVIVQTEGGAVQSAGTHGSAGHYKVANGKSHSYSACIDFSVNRLATRLSDGKKIRMDEAHIKWFLENLAEQNICGFYRLPSQGFEAAHIHAITAQVPISLPLVENQVIDWLNGRNGLKGHATEHFYNASEAHDKAIARAFAKANPIAARRLPAHLQT